MSHLVDFVKYAQRHLLLTALTRAGNRQAQVVQDANDTDQDAEFAKYFEFLGAVNQAQLACDGALLAIARAVMSSDTPFADVSNMLNEAGIDSSPNTTLTIGIVRELQAITKEAR
jgi:hypothetical protein